MSAVALYMRLSSEDANIGDSDSIQSQRDMMYNYLRDHGEFANSTVMEFYDDGYSGVSFNRPGVQNLLRMAGKDVKCVIVKDISRFGRNLVEVGDFLDQVFPALGVRFISINDRYDSGANTGKTIGLDVSMMALMHDLYCRELSGKVRQGQHIKMGKGEFICGIAIYGYRKSDTVKNRLEIDNPAAAVVRRVFAMACEGMSTGEIARTLNDEGVLSPLMYRKQNGSDGMRGFACAGGKSFWTAKAVKRMLDDKRYAGYQVSNKHSRISVGGSRVRALPKDEWIIVADAHEPIVSPDTFDKVGALMRRFKDSAAPAKNSSLFCGFLRCMKCGRNLKKEVRKHSYYYCPTARWLSASACSSIRLIETELETVVLTALKAQLQLFLQAEPQAIRVVSKIEKVRGQIAESQREIERCRTAQATAFENFADGLLSREAFTARKQELAEIIAELTEQVSSLNSELMTLQSENDDSPPAGELERYSLAERLTREMLTLLIKEIRVGCDNRIEIVWNFTDGFRR